MKYEPSYGLHPRLRINNVEFIPFTDILGPIFPKSLLTDQVHLTNAATNKFASFVSQIIGRKTSIKPETSPGTSFLTWVDRKGLSLQEGVPLLQRRPPAPVQRVAPAPAQRAPPGTDRQVIEEMEFENENLLDEDNVHQDDFEYNVEHAMALLEVVTDEEEDL